MTARREINVIRDQQAKTDLKRLGWRVITVWECELRVSEQLASRLKASLKTVKTP